MRVKLALAAKGVAFSTLPQDVASSCRKSPLLLQSNPIHKKVPVLLHHGKPVCESLVICEYIDDAFASANNVGLLPKDPYLKAMARFWANFADKKVMDFLAKLLFVGKGEFEGIVQDIKENLRVVEEKAFPRELEHPFFGGKQPGFVDVVQDVKENLRVLEERAFPRDLIEHPFLGGKQPGFVDVAMGPLVVFLPTMQSLLAEEDEGAYGGDAFGVGKLPRFQAWLKAFGDLPFAPAILPTPANFLKPLKKKRKFHTLP